MSVESWSRRRIGDFAARSKVVNADGTLLPPLSITKDRGVVLQSEKYKKQIATDLRKYIIAQRGQFAFDPMSLYYGAIGRVASMEVGLVSPDYVVFDVNDTVDKTFLNYLLRSPQQVAVYEAVAETGNQFGKRRRVYWSVLEQLEVSMPPLGEQRKIAAILSAVDETIEATQAVIGQLQVVKKAMMSELLTRGLPGRHTRFKQTEIGEVPEGWQVIPLGQAATVGNGSTPSRLRADYWSSGTVPWLPTGKVNERVIRAADEFVTGKALAECAIRLLPKGTLLVAMIGQGKTRGKVAYLAIEATINQNFAFVAPSPSVSSWFLFAYLENNYERIRAEGRGSNQDALNCGLIKQWRIPLPTMAEQEAIAAAMLASDERLASETRSLAGLRVVKSALLSVLLTGKLRVTPDEATA